MRTVSCKQHVLQGTLKLLAVLAPLLFGSVATAQTQTGGTTAPLPTFAVASIRPINYERGHHIDIQVKFTPDGLLDEGVPLILIFKGTFHMQDDRIFGLPDWAQRQPYYIEAKVDLLMCLNLTSSPWIKKWPWSCRYSKIALA
jgi:hypothetical protein